MNRHWWLCLIAVLYGIACALPAVGPLHGDQDPTVYPGYACLVGLPLVLVMPGWWANPLLLAGCWSLWWRWPVAAFLLGLAAIGVAATTFLTFYGKVNIGFWVWLAAIAVLPVAAMHQLAEGPPPVSPTRRVR